MSYQIRIAQRKELESKELWDMYKLRARVFKDRMGWDIPTLSGMEIDGYDALDPHYMLIHDHNDSLKGCWRALPTEGPYMLKDTFPELLHGAEPPSHPKIWELSRFAIETGGQHGFGFSEMTLDALRKIVTFGDSMGIDSYVTVTTTSIERMMRRANFAVTRFGPPIRIGVENAVAIVFDIGQQTHEALFGNHFQAA